MSNSQVEGHDYAALSRGEYPLSLVHLLRTQTEHHPDRIFNTYLQDGEQPGDFRSFGLLDQRARAIAAVLEEQGARGQRAILFYPSGLEFLDAFFGCLYAGVVAVPAFPPDPSHPEQVLARLQALAYDAQAGLLLSTTLVQTVFGATAQNVPVVNQMRWLATDSLPADAADAWHTHLPEPEDPAYLQYTSGSTRTPRGVYLNHRNLAHNSASINRAFRLTTGDVAIIWLPMYHNMGLVGGLLQPLFSSLTCYQMPTQAFLQNPLLWLKNISRYHVTVSGGPNFAYDLCVQRIPADQRAGLDLSSWELAFNGAEAVRPETLDRFTKAFEPFGFRRSAFYPCYGLAESTLIVTGAARKAGPVVQWLDRGELEKNQAMILPAQAPSAQPVISSGCSLPDQELLIVDPEQLEPLADGQIGEIWLRSPSVSPGYWNRPQDTPETFQGFLKSNDAGPNGVGPYLRTGDLGFLYQQQCYISGRLKELIIIHGRNLYPQDIEQTVATSHPALIPGSAAAFSIEVGGEEKLAIVQEVKPAPDQDYQDIVGKMRQAVSQTNHVLLYAIALVEAGSVSKTISGKIQRQLVRKQFLDNEIRAVYTHQMESSAPAQAQPGTPAEAPAISGSLLHAALLAMAPEKAQGLLEVYLLQQIAQALKVPAGSLDPHAPLTSFGLDSITTIEVTGSIQEALGVTISVEPLLQGASLAELVKTILQKLSQPEAEVTAQEEALPQAEPVAKPDEETFADYPLSYGQRALWFIQRLQPESVAHNIVYAATFKTQIDTGAFRRAFQQLTLRHPVMRTRFLEVDGQPVQRVYTGPDHFAVAAEDGSTWDNPALEERLNREVNTPFNLETGPLVRLTFIQRPGEMVMILALHHIITDLWSMVMIFHDLMAFYTAEIQNRQAVLKTAEATYTDTVQWQAEMLAGPRGEEHYAYWKERLSGDLPVLNLPYDHPRSDSPDSSHAATCSIRLTKSLSTAIKELASREGANLFSTLLAAFNTLLYRYTGQTDLLVGTPKAGRNRKNALIAGYYINPVLLRTQLSAEMPFRDLLHRVYRQVQADFQHDEYPFPLLVERLQPTRDLGANPLLQVFFSWQKTNQMMGKNQVAALALNDERTPFEMNGIALETLPIPARVTPTELALLVAETDEHLGLTIEYATKLFNKETIQQMLGHLQTLLTAIVTDPSQPVATAPLLTGEERQRILVEWNQSSILAAGKEELALPIHTWIEGQALQAPDHLAVELDGQTLTYQELIKKSRALARKLIAIGAGPGKVVALCVDRSPEQIVGLLGILQAGSAYLPLDPEYPPDRLAYMLSDSAAAALLTQSWLVDRLPDGNQPRVMLDQDLETLPDSGAISLPAARPNDPAYIMYTSGSTGWPKGVLIPHRAIVHHCRFMQGYYQMTPADRVLQFASLNFDASLEQIFTTLISGAQLVLRGKTVWDPADLSKVIADRRLTVVNIPPAYWSQWVTSETEHPTAIENPQLRLVIIGGDVLHTETLNLWRSLPVSSARLINAYGPTETTITATAYEVTAETTVPVPIGKPMAGRSAYILDANRQLVPIGIPGELYIGGSCLALGYWNQPDLTHEKFVPDLFQPATGSRLYRTGDLARYRHDGNIEFLGRVDRQVKILGIRIELGEIEAALLQHPAISTATIVQVSQPSQRLVACLIAKEGSNPDGEDFSAYLAHKLPRYMIPADYLFFGAFPLMPNGKLDRNALTQACEQRLSLNPGERKGSYVAPRNEIEAYLACLWAQLLDLELVGIHDNFFALGGHSLMAIQIMSRVRERYLVEVPLRKLFETPTIANLALAIIQEMATEEPDEDLERLLAEIEDEPEEIDPNIEKPRI